MYVFKVQRFSSNHNLPIDTNCIKALATSQRELESICVSFLMIHFIANVKPRSIIEYVDICAPVKKA